MAPPTYQSTLHHLSAELGSDLLERGWTVATAESCTGGGIAAAITEVAGSSAWFGTGIVSYANAAKQQLLGVETEVLERCGAVSREVVEQMAQGALRVGGADIAVSVSGIAGPDGGTPDKPVGTVWLAWAGPGDALLSECYVYEGSRAQVREQASVTALRGLLAIIRQNPVKNTV
ncbi:CinA family protein [Gilvimarinus sp. SDUM040013]|uniref:CinA family protein n=1 Tax=Gilvimarinus gilvus TaxID=3058038 RepID=A0ABU4S1S0_9GAMM|nr:CinA family protein [Gilvimarinus sp. SDUM040013]MDO3386598.1 CinA family protein [Gilvimarinus sp. SDUM040013]MDX6849174.1 CinA family protein [Gilvimarinus sp. SDUM040013]